MTKYKMRKIIISGIFLLILAIGSSQIFTATSAQEDNSVITLNPGATDSASQNPITPTNITVPVGTNVTWINKDSSPHFIVSGTPEEGPNNIFYGDYFGTDEDYTVTMENPGLYSYYDPAWSHIRGEISVEDVNIPTEPAASETNLSGNSFDDNLTLYSDNNSLSTAEVGSLLSPSPSPQSSFPSFTSNDTSDQSSPLSSLVSDQTISNIIHKVGPLLGLLMNSGNSSLSSSSSPLSSLSQSNGMSEEGLMNFANISTTGSEDTKSLDSNSSSLLN